jgi:large-conductance mechanosensitive channel
MNMMNTPNTPIYKSVGKQIVVIIIGSLSLMASLAWNEAVKATIDHYYPNNLNKNNFLQKILYAVILSTLIIVIVYLLTKYISENSK